MSEQVNQNPGTPGELPGITCEHCDIWLPDFTCYACGASYCPYCGAHRFVECQHLVMSWDDDNGTHLRGLNPDEERDANYTGPSLPENSEVPELAEQEIRTLFGNAYPLLEAYEGSLAEACSESLLPELLQQVISVPIRQVKWEGQGMAAGAGEDYFSPNPEGAKAEMRQLLQQLDAGFHALEEIVQ